jgi:hypothetical protein
MAQVETQVTDRPSSDQPANEEQPGELEALERVRKCLF